LDGLKGCGSGVEAMKHEKTNVKVKFRGTRGQKELRRSVWRWELLKWI